MTVRDMNYECHRRGVSAFWKLIDTIKAEAPDGRMTIMYQYSAEVEPNRGAKLVLTAAFSPDLPIDPQFQIIDEDYKALANVSSFEEMLDWVAEYALT